MLQNVTEKIVFVSIAVILSGAAWRTLSGGGEGGVDGDPRTQIILAFIYAVLAIFALVDIRRTSLSFLQNPALVGLLLLACLSPLWSDSPDLVFRRAIGLTGTTLFGIVFATRYSFDEQLRILRWALRGAAAATLTLLLVSSSRAFSAPGGGDGLRGVFPHKNMLGAAMALAFLVEWYLREQDGKRKALKLFSLCVYGGLLLASDSMTSIVTLVTTLCGVWIVQFLCARHGVPLSAIVIFGAVGGFALTMTGIGPGDLLQLVGRSSDMTGRTELWDAVADAIMQKPILGFGYSGFWNGASAGSDLVHAQIHWTPTYSHNGYLEISLSLGLAGLLLVMALFAQGFRHAWAKGKAGDSPEDLWPLALLMFVAIHNLAECSIAWQNCLEWSVCVATMVGCNQKFLATSESREEIEDSSSEAALEGA